MTPEEARGEGMRHALRRVEGMALLPALELLLSDADEAARLIRDRAEDPADLLKASGAYGMAAGLRLAATLAHDRAFREEA